MDGWTKDRYRQLRDRCTKQGQTNGTEDRKMEGRIDKGTDGYIKGRDSQMEEQTDR